VQVISRRRHGAAALPPITVAGCLSYFTAGKWPQITSLAALLRVAPIDFRIWVLGLWACSSPGELRRGRICAAALGLLVGGAIGGER
jgi:hypothetical protein